MPGPGQILVSVHAAGVNRPDVMQRQGNYPPPPGASDVFGLELAGIVAELGEGVTDFAKGDRVMALVHSGAYADWAVVDAPIALKLPDAMSMVEAGAFPETFFTVWSNVFERGGLVRGPLRESCSAAPGQKRRMQREALQDGLPPPQPALRLFGGADTRKSTARTRSRAASSTTRSRSRRPPPPPRTPSPSTRDCL